MNIRFTFKQWLPALLATIATGFAGVWLLAPKQSQAEAKSAESTELSLADRRILVANFRLVLAQRCQPCHSKQPTDKTFAAPPQGVTFDTLDEAKARAAKIKTRAVDTKTMPFANKTGMTDEERAIIDQWVAAGSPID